LAGRETLDPDVIKIQNVARSSPVEQTFPGLESEPFIAIRREKLRLEALIETFNLQRSLKV
jgi:hypothetical protein